MPICDVKSQSQNQLSACGKLETGAIRTGSKVQDFVDLFMVLFRMLMYHSSYVKLILFNPELLAMYVKMVLILC